MQQSNVTVISNIVVMSGKYSINIHDVDKNDYYLSDNKCYSLTLTPDTELNPIINGSYTVTNTSGNFENLALAINTVIDGGVINLIGNIRLDGGEYFQKSGIVIDKNITIVGNNYIIDINNKNARAFDVTDNGVLTLYNTIITGSKLLFDDLHSDDLSDIETEYSGGTIFNSGILNIYNSYFLFNEANIGGAIYNEGNAYITDSYINYNKAISVNEYAWDIMGNSLEDDTINIFLKEGGCAGAIFNNGHMIISDTWLYGNEAERGSGAIFNNGFLDASNCEFFNNFASGPAAFCGAVYANNTTILKNSSFHNNRASSGGVINSNKCNLTIINCNLHNNRAYYDHWGAQGGVIFSSGGNISLINSTFAINTAEMSGGVIEIYDIGHKANTNLNIDGCQFNDNYNEVINMYSSGSLNIKNSIFNDNRGGIVINNKGGADMSIVDSVIKNNNGESGISNGLGAVFSNGKNNYISGTTFIGNKGSNGGVLTLYGNSIIVNSEFINNFAKLNGGAINNHGLLTILDTIFDGNKAGKGDAIFYYNKYRPDDLIKNGYFDSEGNYHIVLPVDPDVPVNPDVPVDPDVPVNPVDPVDPDVPVNPVDPVDPDVPVNPDVPVDPGLTDPDNDIDDFKNSTNSNNPDSLNNGNEVNSSKVIEDIIV